MYVQYVLTENITMS